MSAVAYEPLAPPDGPWPRAATVVVRLCGTSKLSTCDSRGKITSAEAAEAGRR
ncbi:hypothetical protein ACIBH1_16585 [Nonomuraea sp. NPDC050663]|uniref:hypothetical protein n=1 Tax=Nonomuraea sp. NPDC050663 TaxID=3364370 RepID=UPI0037937BAA